MIKDIRYVEWSDGFKVNIKVIDKQHKHFIGIMDKLFKAMQSNEKMAVPKIIDELVEYADVHFATEQELFSKYKYPAADEHIAEHRMIQDKIAGFVAKKYDDPFKLGYNLLDLLEDWLLKHLASMDIKYAKFLHEQGVK